MSHSDWNTECREAKQLNQSCSFNFILVACAMCACTNWILAHQRLTFYFDKSTDRFLFCILNWMLFRFVWWFFNDLPTNICIAGQHEMNFLHKSIVLIIDTTTRSEMKPFEMAIAGYCNALRWNEAKKQGDKNGKSIRLCSKTENKNSN